MVLIVLHFLFCISCPHCFIIFFVVPFENFLGREVVVCGLVWIDIFGFASTWVDGWDGVGRWMDL